MSFFDKAKKLAAQAKELADDALAKASAGRDADDETAPSPPADPRLVTPFHEVRPNELIVQTFTFEGVRDGYERLDELLASEG